MVRTDFVLMFSENDNADFNTAPEFASKMKGVRELILHTHKRRGRRRTLRFSLGNEIGQWCYLQRPPKLTLNVNQMNKMAPHIV